ncbi:MAG: hypothetical protein LH632_15005, partial [Rhodoferax sp.]|nr:hypothetical protein [Rhodoferax sp.]
MTSANQLATSPLGTTLEQRSNHERELLLCKPEQDARPQHLGHHLPAPKRTDPTTGKQGLRVRQSLKTDKEQEAATLRAQMNALLASPQ